MNYTNNWQPPVPCPTFKTILSFPSSAGKYYKQSHTIGSQGAGPLTLRMLKFSQNLMTKKSTSGLNDYIFLLLFVFCELFKWNRGLGLNHPPQKGLE